MKIKVAAKAKKMALHSSKWDREGQKAWLITKMSLLLMSLVAKSGRAQPQVQCRRMVGFSGSWADGCGGERPCAKALGSSSTMHHVKKWKL